MKVDFLVIGAQKAGTSTLTGLLAAHPSICFSEPREPAYFDRPDAGAVGLERYHAHFSPRPGQLCGEGSTAYTMLPTSIGTAERIHAYDQAMRLVYLVRDPVERVRSHHAHRHVRRTGPPDLEGALRASADLLDRSLYSVQLRPYLDLFPRTQLHLVVLEELVVSPRAVLDELTSFLGIEPFDDVAVERRHGSTEVSYLSERAQRSLLAAPWLQEVAARLPPAARRRLRAPFARQLARKADLDPDLEAALRRILDPEIAAVEALLGREVPAWRRPS